MENEQELKKVCLDLQKAFNQSLNDIEKQAKTEEEKEYTQGLALFIFLQAFNKYEDMQNDKKIDQMMKEISA